MKNFQFNGELESIKPDYEKTELYVVTTEPSLFKLQMTSSGPYTCLKFDCLQHINGLQKALDQMAPFDSMSVSDRTLIYKDKVFSIGSGDEFYALSSTLLENGQVTKSQIIEHTDKLVYVVHHDNEIRLIFKNDAGRRDLCPVGYRVLSYVVSATELCPETLLFQIIKSISPQTGQVETYWTIMGFDD